jgi:hypothetical protein
MRALPSPPETVDYASRAKAALSQMYLNDTEGDCVIAGMAHIAGVLLGNRSGFPLIFDSTEINALYGAIGGYDPSQTQPDGSNPTDNGCDEETALNYWHNQGLFDGQYKIAGSISVNGRDPGEVRTALWLFENLFFGIELPDAWTKQLPAASGFTWDAAGAADPANGHCVIGAGYNPSGIVIDTWGMLGTLTNAAIAEYAIPENGGALYTVVSFDAINRATQKAPNGFDWSQLIADFDSMGGNVSASVKAKG